MSEEQAAQDEEYLAVEDRSVSIAFRTDVWTAEEIEQIKARAHERWERMQQFID